jgi:hypothetical protein
MLPGASEKQGVAVGVAKLEAAQAVVGVFKWLCPRMTAVLLLGAGVPADRAALSANAAHRAGAKHTLLIHRRADVLHWRLLSWRSGEPRPIFERFAAWASFSQWLP